MTAVGTVLYGKNKQFLTYIFKTTLQSDNNKLVWVLMFVYKHIPILHYKRSFA